MSEPITLEDIYKLFEKTNQQLNEQLQQSRQEFDRRMAEMKAESDRRQAEAKAEADRSMAELQKTVARTSKAVDSLTTRWGRFVEELVEPAIIKLFRERGIDVKETFSRGRVTRQGVAMEIDIVAVDDTELVAVECKSRLSKDDVDEFLEKLQLFKQAFPHFQSFEVYGAVAGIEIDEGIDRYAYKKGLFVIKPSGDTVEIINDSQFRGRKW
ncbi:conserved hypothetical protein [Rippkaea orientalis PCC 8801]|uniref:DUF3782 domain-containing protein n=1 Tax=Rippkaea orientalis (strain PCC 8801 / RF-1) TaxID=41431 RepID=B7JV03_RIPO1|nr:DUF3782 domain-containing protein [Rippkaea orientalis]ACK66855.1 conserved hypothetical protein [Rippkaea orientalis PCC 8801]